MTPTKPDTDFENPEDRLDLLVAELRIWIDRAHVALRAQAVKRDPLLPYTAALKQVDLIERIVFEQPTIGEEDNSHVNLDVLVLRSFDASPDEKTALLLANVAATFRFIDERAWPSHRVLSRRDGAAPWGPDDPRPIRDTSLIADGKEGAFSLSLAYDVLIEGLRAMIDPVPVVSDNAHARADEVWAASLARSLARDRRLFRRASRLSLLDDPSEIAFLSRANSRIFANTARAWGSGWVRALDDEVLDGRLKTFDAVANRVATELAEIPTVYDRPLPPPIPTDRATEFALYRLALAHQALRNTLDKALPLPTPWPGALAALEAGTGEIERALLAALDDPAPHYGPAQSLGQRWSAYDTLVSQLPLDRLDSPTRPAFVERAKNVAARARELVSTSRE